jgi:cell division protease FtsH
MVGEAMEKATTVLERNWPAVEETAQALIEHESLSGVALDAVLSTVQAMPLTVTSRAGRYPRRRTTTDS